MKETMDGLSEDEIQGHCADNMPGFRVPKQFHFIDALPKNDRGKVRRPDLQTLWQEEHTA